MNDNKLNVAHNYSEHQVDFALIGKTAENAYCIQLISNKPFPTVKSVNDVDSQNTNIELEVKTKLVHESTIYMSHPQLLLLKKAIDKAVSEFNAE